MSPKILRLTTPNKREISHDIVVQCVIAVMRCEQKMNNDMVCLRVCIYFFHLSVSCMYYNKPCIMAVRKRVIFNVLWIFARLIFRIVLAVCKNL